MKKIKTSHNLFIPGWGTIPAETTFKVIRFNKRFIYVSLNDGVELKLARKKGLHNSLLINKSTGR